VVCGTHDEIRRVTEAIRNDLKTSGKLGTNHQLTRDVLLNWTAAHETRLDSGAAYGSMGSLPTQNGFQWQTNSQTSNQHRNQASNSLNNQHQNETNNTKEIGLRLMAS